MKSETPRTDAMVRKILSDLQSGTMEVVHAEFARELERELATAKSRQLRTDAVELPVWLFSDAQVSDWAKRNDLLNCGSITDLRCMFEDAASTKPETLNNDRRQLQTDEQLIKSVRIYE